MDIQDDFIQDFDEPAPIKIIKKPNKCTKCSGKLIRVIYGEPTDKTWNLVKNKKAFLGGCCIAIDQKILWKCVNCRQGYYK